MVEHRKISRSGVFAAIYLLYVVIIELIFGYAKANHLIFRQYFAFINSIFIFAGLFCVIVLCRKKIPKEKKKARLALSALMVIVACITLFVLLAQTVFGDKESVITIDGEKKIKVESSFFMSLAISYYDYVDAFCYKAYPCVTESYDDCDINDLIYIDYYDEDGTLFKRVFVGDE